MDLFLLKKIVSAMVMPLSIVLILLVIALLLFSYNRKTSFLSLTFATLLLFLSAFSPVSDRLMLPIENQYEAFTRSDIPLDYIVVLGCDHISNDALPATSQLLPCSLVRLVEAIRIFRLHPEATIIASGYAGNDEVSNAEKVKQSAILLGVPESKIMTENFPQDTAEEAELIAPRVIGKNIALVTSASHMPRALTYFLNEGVNPIAAPASPWVKNINEEKHWQHYVPSADKIKQTTRAWYETLGLLVQWLKN